ncbi:MAG: proline--tRNA ligase [Anaerolineales bacterium]
MSQLFSRTLRQAPADTEVTSQKLLVRAGFLRQLGAGIYSYLPLAHRSMTKIENILRDEINAIGGQELTMPVVHPADIWKETERWYQVGSEMGRFKDKNDRDMVLAMTHEEVVGDLVRQIVQSYRQLPCLIYHIQTKWRDDPRPRAGLIRVREFTMKDSYSLDAGWEGLDRQYRAHYQAYFNIFNRCSLPSVAVESDVGMMGGKLAHEYMYLTPIGEDTLVICDECGYIANRQIATFQKPSPAEEGAQPPEKVATPDTKTIATLADFLDVPESQTAKAVFMIATLTEKKKDVQKFIFAIVRGDMDLNETKLTNAIKAKDLRPAQDEEIIAVGAEPGYASPVGLAKNENVLVVVDDLIPHSPNLVAGANEAGYHLKNVNYGRDYEAGIVTDIVNAAAGYACSSCGGTLRTSRGVEVGNIFKLGTRYSDDLKCTFIDKDGQLKPVIMGSYGIGVGRLLACIAEEYNDKYGLIWPITVAPYQVHIVSLKDAGYAASVIYEQLQEVGVEVLYDDRNESAGVKFNDADLIGIPLRVTAGKRGLQRGEVELKRRSERERKRIPVDEIVERVQEEIAALKAKIMAKVVPVEYKV